jgi:hypothetical protein
MELILGLILSLTAAVVGVWRVTATRDRPIHGPRADEMFRLPSLERYSTKHRGRRLENLRQLSPRAEIGRYVVILAAVVAIAVLGFIAATVLRQTAGPETSEVEDTLARVVSLRAEASSASDPNVSRELLQQANDEISAVMEQMEPGPLRDDLAREQQSIAVELDRLGLISRLPQVQVLGAVPVGSGARPSIFSGAGRLYLVSDALYQVDSTSGQLVRLLGAGDIVNGVPVGQIQGAAWRDDGPLVLDSEAAYVFDTTRGNWFREPLGKAEDGQPLSITAVAVFDYNLYILEREHGRILKYAGGDYESAPEVWSDGLAGIDLSAASDFVIDGSVYVLLGNGQVLDLFLSRLEATWEPAVQPPLESAAGLFSSSNTADLYMVNTGDGRIVRINRQGQLVQQFLPEPGTRSLAGATDIVVDETTGISYVLSNDVLLTTRLGLNPGAPVQEDAAGVQRRLQENRH